jgi:UDP-N-acetylmuramoyl-tripeptide--D-alanyl-D-alanine ligase
MQVFLLLILAIIWLSGTWLRIYKQARFYQIEEYMSRRYLRWIMNNRNHLFPARSIGAWFIGVALGFLMGEAPNSVLPVIIGILAGLIASIPQSEGEVKKKLIRTQRVTRIIGSGFFVSGFLLIALNLVSNSLTLPDINIIEIALVSTLGFILFLLAPLWLMLGNILMIPVETYMRQRFLNQASQVLDNIRPKVIGITGSYGKTTTKNFLYDIMSVRYRTYATPKSYNTLMGISLSINRDLTDDYSVEYFISEMGAYVEGEIERICKLTPPDISIVTEIGPQHLERFGTLENVKKAKYEIITNLAPDGVAVFNWDNPYIQDMVKQGYPNTQLTVSRELTLEEAKAQNITWLATDIQETLAGLSFNIINIQTDEQEHITTAIVGEHNVTNLLLSTAVAHQEGIPLRDIAFRIRSLQPAESRLVIQTTAEGITIINDAYSANPKGVISALKVLGMYQTGKRLLITPGMVELGDLHEVENRKLGELATQYASDIILIGKEQTKPIFEGIQSSTFDMNNVKVKETLTEAVDWYQSNLKSGDTVLFLNDLPDTY